MAKKPLPLVDRNADRAETKQRWSFDRVAVEGVTQCLDLLPILFEPQGFDSCSYC